MRFDASSPGFVIKVSTGTNEARIKGKADPKTKGKDLEGMDDVTSRVLSFTFEDCEEEHDVLRLRVDNSDFHFFEHPAWVKGNRVEFFFGYPNRVSQPRRAIVDNMRGFLALEITCVEEAGRDQ